MIKVATQQVIYGNLRVSYNSLEELISKVANYFGVPEAPADYLIVKALKRVKAEQDARIKRAEKQGKEVKEKTFTDL